MEAVKEKRRAVGGIGNEITYGMINAVVRARPLSSTLLNVLLLSGVQLVQMHYMMRCSKVMASSRCCVKLLA